MYDAIVVGARVAGSPTAMLLARKGYRVLLVDRATFPSDTLSTHQIQIAGSMALKRWGLLDRVLATDLVGAHRVRFDQGSVVLDGEFPTAEGIDAVYSPRRYLLDKILLDAAAEAGAEVCEGFITEELLWENEAVVGIRGRTKDGRTIMERARMVIGADGRHSLVAEQVKAPKYDEVPALTCAYYSYWEGVPLAGGELYGRSKRLLGVWPTNNQLTMIFVSWPTAEFHNFRADVEGSYRSTIDLIPALADRVRGGRRAERIMGTADTHNFYRKPYGPGWALVGDAGHSKDPVSGLGISDAFRDAELLAQALDAGFAGRQPLETALYNYEQQRNTTSKAAYDFTVDIARMRPPTIEQVALFAALARNPSAANQFFGVLTGIVPANEFFSGSNVFHLLGIGGMAKVMLNKMFSPRKAIDQPAAAPQA